MAKFVKTKTNQSLGGRTPPGANPPAKKWGGLFIFANSRRSMMAIVLHMAFAMVGGGGASRWQPR
jgi:hypothetical protein